MAMQSTLASDGYLHRYQHPSLVAIVADAQRDDVLGSVAFHLVKLRGTCSDSKGH